MKTHDELNNIHPDMTPTTPNQNVIERIEYLARLLDSQFALPGTNFRFGADGLIGLIPGIGDTVSGLLSAYIIGEAARAGVRKRALARMTWNTLVDTILGAIPLVGDIFDFAFKANRKNAQIALAELRRQPTS